MPCWCLQILQQEYYFHKIIIKMLNIIFVFISEVYRELLSKVTFWLFFCIENHSCWLVNFKLYYPFLFQHQLQMLGAHEWWLSSSWSQALNITTSSNSSNYVDSCDFCFLKEIFCHFFLELIGFKPTVLSPSTVLSICGKNCFSLGRIVY